MTYLMDFAYIAHIVFFEIHMWVTEELTRLKNNNFTQMSNIKYGL